ncbi:hypothetical protein PGTUg99_026751 [Puccinia graminis f. sp. tritici]|uniref:Uncharacterized protein n=1 Tax=Puccinia graminis f. sp. tritici TaxID=56615 RepID=A0A5B0NJ05_PUCGR|nr:hypothetical protein PGTUg99_026751 [Puccinia graminis f. sp. tritici]
MAGSIAQSKSISFKSLIQRQVVESFDNPPSPINVLISFFGVTKERLTDPLFSLIDNRYSRAILNLPQEELTSFFNTFLFLQQHINHVGDVGRKASAELHHGASFLKLAPSAGRFPEESVQRMRSERPRDALASQHHLDASKSIQVTLAKYEASDGR